MKNFILLGLLAISLNSWSNTEWAGDELPCIQDGKLVAKKATEEQKEQLYLEGEITDCAGNVYDIVYIPGEKVVGEIIDESAKLFVKSWKSVVDKETYTDTWLGMKEAYEYGSEIVWDGLGDMKEGLVDTIYFGTIKDWQEGHVLAAKILDEAKVVDANGNVDYEMGAKASSFAHKWIYPIFHTLGNFFVGAFETAWGVVETAFGGFVTGAGITIYPVVNVTYQPIFGTLAGALGTTVVPGTVYAWNGATWYVTKDSILPTGEREVLGVQTVDVIKRVEIPADEQEQVEVEETEQLEPIVDNTDA